MFEAEGSGGGVEGYVGGEDPAAPAVTLGDGRGYREEHDSGRREAVGGGGIGGETEEWEARRRNRKTYGGRSEGSGEGELGGGRVIVQEENLQHRPHHTSPYHTSHHTSVFPNQ